MNKSNYTNDYYLKKISEIESKIEPHLNDALMSVYGEFLSLNTKSEFPLFFFLFLVVPSFQIHY